MRDKILKFTGIAEAVAAMSKDNSTKVGALILGPNLEIRSTGYNGFPRKVDESIADRHVRPTKYAYTVHGEANAIAQAARVGAPLDGCSMIITSLFPCTGCSKLIIQSGIIAIYAPQTPQNDRWNEEAEIALTMLNEAGVLVNYY